MRADAFLDSAAILAHASNKAIGSGHLPAMVEVAEALSRSSASRSYYAVYHYAKAVAIALNYEPPKIGRRGSVHADLWKFYDLFDEAVANRCRSLKQNRTKADYDLHITFAADPLALLASAERAIGMIYELSQTP